MSYYMEVSSCPTLPLSWVSNCPVSKCPVSKCPVSSCPGFVPDIGQGEMVDDWWESAPGKIATHPNLRWESGGGGGVWLSFW